MADVETTSDDALNATPVLSLRGITKRFGQLVANDRVDLTLARGEVLALLGENGAGKTTLMSILFGEYVADAGEVHAFGKPLPPGSPRAAIAAGIGLVHQHFTLADNLTVLDNVILGTEPLWSLWSRRTDGRRKLLTLAKRFGLQIDPEARVADLSVGERQRVEILKALYRDARILVMDEPTAVLVPHEVDGLFATLRELVGQGLSVIFISHKLREVMAIANRIVVLRRGRVVAERLTAKADRSELAELMVGQRVTEPLLTKSVPGEPVLRLHEVTLKKAGRHGRVVLDQVNLVVRRHQIVGIAGVSGNGQTALGDIICGLSQPDIGTIEILGEPIGQLSPAAVIKRNVARIPEDRHAVGLVGEMTVWENIIAEQYRSADFSRMGFQRVQSARTYSNKIISDFDVRCPGPDSVTQRLSGGNMQKLILGRTLSRAPTCILASQPTRGLDVGAVAYVHQRLISARGEGAGILLISDDLDELLALSDEVIVIYQGRLYDPISRDEVNVGELSLRMAGQAPHAH